MPLCHHQLVCWHLIVSFYNGNQLLYTVAQTSAFNSLGHKELWFPIILSYALPILKHIYWCLGIKRHCHSLNSSSKCLRKEKWKHSQLLMEHRQDLTKEDWIVYKPCPGARFSKVPKTFRALKAICEIANRLFWKSDLLTCFQGNKNKNNCEVWRIKCSPFLSYKGNCDTRK